MANVIKKIIFLVALLFFVLIISGCAEQSVDIPSESEKIGSSDILNMHNTNHNSIIGDFNVWSKAEEKKDKVVVSGTITNNGTQVDSLVLYVSMHENDGKNIYDGEWAKDNEIFKDKSNMTKSLVINPNQTIEFRIELNKNEIGKLSSIAVDVEKYQIHLYNDI